MAKKKKPATDDFDPTPLIVIASKCYDAEGDPRIGLLAIETVSDLYQFLITETAAKDMIQELRDFLAEDAERLP